MHTAVEHRLQDPLRDVAFADFPIAQDVVTLFLSGDYSLVLPVLPPSEVPHEPDADDASQDGADVTQQDGFA